ncbi:M48 family metallopeptidase [Erwiniaceae bacterium BAC15a-03b]|uniref:M48 family metallopeptidase n=1 Tax=Winslowiella arboricola TaxID=2978220 RepID=A0A9J6PJE0_9GAMM|nr:M48 family metallopeptidase [Winslowiella arboricola]MCU5773660.1 M48 family metallopeptidase [Winslowiella arboricola]MCU5778441.1 M48 family metallopeptidase [Winslowiella arboricola]
MHLSGYYQHPGRAARETARLSLYSQHFSLHLAAADTQFLLKDITLSDALGTIPLTITFADGGRFVPEDDAQLRQWVTQHQRLGWVHRLERNKRGVFATMLATLLMIVVTIWIVLPFASRQLALHIPDYVEQQVGRQTFQLLQRVGFQESQLPEARQRHVKRLFSDVLLASGLQDTTPPQLKLMHFPGVANALMLADGSVVITDELVKLAPDDDALAAVMLHELGHHRWRHPMRMLVRSSLVSLSFMWMTGDVSGIGDTLLQSAAFLHQLQFSRGMEREADNWAIVQMAAQGRSLTEMAKMYAVIQQAGERGSPGVKTPEWLSTHPDMPLRIEAIKKAAEGL